MSSSHGLSHDREVSGGPSSTHGLVVQRSEVSAASANIEALRKADRPTDEFLATLGHELRNPLCPIKAAVQVLRRFGPSSHQRKALDIIDRQVASLANLAEDLMDVASIRIGRLTLHTAYVGLQQVVAQALETSQPLIDAHQHNVTIRLPDTPLIIEADCAKLVRVLSNLLNNAAKYTPPGGLITLEADFDADHVQIGIADTGIGISPEALPHVFAMFMQTPQARPRSNGGLGIGLPLVHQLVELHGGTVVAKSPGLGQGSEFIVSLPRRTFKPGPCGQIAE